MGYHHIDPDTLDQFDDRPVDIRSISTAAGLDYQDSPLGLRQYIVQPGQKTPLAYHYHDEQVEVFYVLEGQLHVKTTEGEFVIGADEVFIAEPGNPHLAFNPSEATDPVRLLAIGAPSVDDAHVYDPDEETSANGT